MLFLLACASLTDTSPILGDSEASACFDTCATLWTPLPVCVEMAQRSDPPLTVEACQADCLRADVYIDAIHDNVADAWVDAIAGYMVDYGEDGCVEAVQRAGGSPCSRSEVYCKDPT